MAELAANELKDSLPWNPAADDARLITGSLRGLSGLAHRHHATALWDNTTAKDERFFLASPPPPPSISPHYHPGLYLQQMNLHTIMEMPPTLSHPFRGWRGGGARSGESIPCAMRRKVFPSVLVTKYLTPLWAVLVRRTLLGGR